MGAHGAGRKSGFLHIWGRRGAGRGLGCGRRGPREAGGYRFGARRIQIRGPNLYRPARDTASGTNVWRAPALLATHSGPERVATCTGYRFGYECVAAGPGPSPRPLAIQIRRPNVYRPARDTGSGANVWQRARRGSAVRVFGPHRPRYKPYLATACRMRAPHGTQIAARKPTVAAPCRQSHGRPAAYAATMAGQVMGST